MGLPIARGSDYDYGKRNLKGVLYILGDEICDGSIRIILDNNQTKIQNRINGIWTLLGVVGDSSGAVSDFTISRELDLTFDREGNFTIERTP